MIGLRKFLLAETPPVILNKGYLQYLGIAIFVTVLLQETVSCSGPAVIVRNKTEFPVRAFVTYPGGRAVLSPSPGESSEAEVAVGAYRVVVVNDSEWINYAKLKQKVLTDTLANPRNLRTEQVESLIEQLRDITAKIESYGQAAGEGATCGGRVSEDSDGLAEVSQGMDGKLYVSCK